MWGGVDKYQTCLTCEKLEGGGERDHIIYLPQCNQMFDFFCAEKVFNVDD